MSEAAVLKRILLACSRGSSRLMRNNVGALQDKEGRWVRYGVGGNGGSDLIGWKSVEVTPDLLGRTVAIFSAVEVKEKGRVTKEQEAFLNAVARAGGLAGVARSPEEAAAILDNLPGQEPPQ